MKQFMVWVLRVVPAIILLQTLFFKFTGAEESVFIFSAIGAEPWGRIGSGIVELFAAVLLLIPRTTVFGALLSVGTMAGALLVHLTVIGVEVMADGGYLFVLGLVVMFCSLVLLWLERKKVVGLINHF